MKLTTEIHKEMIKYHELCSAYKGLDDIEKQISEISLSFWITNPSDELGTQFNKDLTNIRDILFHMKHILDLQDEDMYEE